MFSLVFSKRKIERRAFVHFCLSPDPAAVTVNDALAGRQADAAAREFIRRMQALERAEEFVRIRHIEADAVVRYAVYRFALTLSFGHPSPAGRGGRENSEMDFRLGARGGELEGVAH